MPGSAKLASRRPAMTWGGQKPAPKKDLYQVASTEPLNFSSMNAFTSGDW